jgi:hypothetical protein
VASRNHRNITGSGTLEKSHSAYPCEVAGGSSLAEPQDDSSAAEALGSLAGTWRPGRTLCAAASVLAEAMYAVVAPRRPRGNRGPETERSPLERLSSRRWVRRAARRRARPVGAPFVPVESADRSVDGVEALRGPQHPCWRALVPQRQVRRGPGWPGLPPRTEFIAVGDAHEVAVPCGLKVQAPEPDFESGWEGVRVAHGIPLAAVLGANHHREG